MAITVPVIFTDIDELELDENRPVSEETVRKMIQNVNLLGSLAPIGLVVAVAVNTPSVPPVNSTLFQYCDGGQITDTTSPLRATAGHPRASPNMADKYLRGAPNATTNPDTGDLPAGGHATRNLSHNHTGGTGQIAGPSNVGEDGDERHAYDLNFPFHNHPISSDLSSTDPIDLAHIQTAFYLKIN